MIFPKQGVCFYVYAHDWLKVESDSRHLLCLIRTGLGGTIRNGIPAKFSFTFVTTSKSLESPLILRKLCDGEIFGVGCITLMSI